MMINTLCDARVFAYPDGSDAALALGATPRGAASFRLSADRGTFAPERPLTHVFAPDGAQLGARKQNNSMTLIAAAGGASGPLPDWDPV